MTTADLVETEEQRIQRWRREELERAGYNPMSAEALARRPDVDLHRAVDMIKGGCPQDVAVRILL